MVSTDHGMQSMDTVRQMAEVLADTYMGAGLQGHHVHPALRAKQGARTTYALSISVGCT